jgi:methyl-accepting chemotaxis protein
MPENLVNKLEKVALTITRGVGSVWSLIIHTIVFIASFSLVLFGIKFELVLLVLTTILSLEAIYLSIFIQLSVNQQAKALASVEKDIDEIQEDVEEIAEDVEEIAEDVEGIHEAHEEIQENIEEIQEDIEEIAEDVEEMQEDIDEIQEDVEEISEEEESLKKITE